MRVSRVLRFSWDDRFVATSLKVRIEPRTHFGGNGLNQDLGFRFAFFSKLVTFLTSSLSK